MGRVKFKIAEQTFFNSGELLLPTIKDRDGNELECGIKSWLEQQYELDSEMRSGKEKFNADQLNVVLREKMLIPGIHGETYVENGAILVKGKEGFDFSLFDEEYNIIKLRNIFIGNPGRYGGDNNKTGIYSINKHVPNAEGTVYRYKKDWRAKLDTLTKTPGSNIVATKHQYTVVGELQFGNWALAEHDLLRLMNSAIDGEIDYYIYITDTGLLTERLSSGIVTYSKVIELFKKNIQLIRTPTWVIGLDLDG